MSDTNDKRHLWGGKGKRTYNNGVIAKRYFEGEQPGGFVLGMLPRTDEQKAESNAKRVKTTIEKYGVSNVAQSKDVYEKMLETNLKKYGVEHPQSLESQKEKVKKTNLERYGTTNGKVLKPKVVKPKREKKVEVHKVKDTRKGHYYNNGIITRKIKEGDVIPDGFVRGMLLSDELKKNRSAKAKETFLKKYGVDNPAKSKEVLVKIQKTNLDRYGVEHSSQSVVVKEKVKKSNLAKYGVEYSFQANEVKEKIKQTNLDKYGVDNPSKSEVIKQRIVESNRKNLGVDYPMQSKEVLDKSRITSLQKYGTEYPNQSEIVKQHIKESSLRIYGVEHPFMSDVVIDKVLKTNLDRYGVPCYLMLTKRWKEANDSKPNRDFASLLDANNIKYEREFRCGKYSYDFKVVNTLIEINPTATHNTYFSPYGDKSVKGKYYHRDKSKLARDSGYNVIHVFDWDDKSKIINLLRDRDIVYARKCDVRLVDSVECNQYLMTYHLQDKCNSQTIRLGLYYNNQLVSLMTFGVARYNKKYEYELLRYCASHNVIGGAEKLFKYFVDTYKPNSVVSYCDTSKFSGKVYDILGFKIDTVNAPSCHWYSVKENKHITDNLLRMQGYDRLFKENHGKGTSNEELILSRGYLPVYDCGQATYYWKSHKNVE